MTSIWNAENGVLERRENGELLRIEPWGRDSVRVRATKLPELSPRDWALTEPRQGSAETRLLADGGAELRNGRLRVRVNDEGILTFFRDGQPVLREYDRHRRNLYRYCSPLGYSSREMRARPGGHYQLTARFEAEPEEKIFGMGQYQHGFLDQKGCRLELAQRNTQASVPFAVSSKGYGFLWNNPAVGTVTFGKNLTEWTAESSPQLDYWVTVGGTPAEIEENYANAVGKAPLPPTYATGFWQSKLRYQTQEELLEVAREYKRRGLPLSVIVVDFFHWTNHGEWKFDPDYWPDPEAMVRELKEMGVELMVSIWPTVAHDSENYGEMARRDLLVRNDLGVNIHMRLEGVSTFFDATNPESRQFVWDKVREHYYSKGIRTFWLDEAEPEFGNYDFSLYRYRLGPALETSNIYPLYFAKGFFDGQREAGQEKIINLVRCAWAGSQRYGALVWSGDVDSSFRGLREQVAAGLNMGLAGIPWWTTDIGGFLGGDPTDPEFRECLVRWFQYGAFCPVMRLHGERLPHKKPLGTTGGGRFFSGAENEVWSYGEEAQPILEKYMFLRETLRPYLYEQFERAHEKGTPIIRPLFYDYPGDSMAWEISDEYLLGPNLLVAPVLEAGQRRRSVYLPEGSWVEAHGQRLLKGGRTIECEAPLDVIPVFVRAGSGLTVDL